MSTWIVLSTPEDVKQVFTSDPRTFHAGEGNRTLLPVLGEHSVLLLSRTRASSSASFCCRRFHGARMERYGDLMSGVAAAEIARWPLGVPYRVRPRMQAITLEIVLRAVFGLAGASGSSDCAGSSVACSTCSQSRASCYSRWSSGPSARALWSVSAGAGTRRRPHLR